MSAARISSSPAQADRLEGTGERQHRHAVRQHRRDAGRGLEAFDQRRVHSKLAFTMTWWSFAMRSCSCTIASITVSGSGGQPGTQTITGMILSMPCSTAQFS
jgi:hypothetical protein